MCSTGGMPRAWHKTFSLSPAFPADSSIIRPALPAAIMAQPVCTTRTLSAVSRSMTRTLVKLCLTLGLLQPTMPAAPRIWPDFMASIRGGGSAQRFEQCLHGKPYGPVRRMMRNAQAVFFSVGEILDGLVQNGSGGFLCAVGLKFHIPYERHLEILPWLHHL